MEQTKTKTESFRIYHRVVINFDWKDRIRILLGKKANCNSIIFVDTLCNVVEPSKTEAYAEPIFPPKHLECHEIINGSEEQPFPSRITECHWDDSELQKPTKQ